MFLRWGAVYSRAHLISAIRAVFVYSLCVSLALPGGAAFAASDSVFVQGTGAPNAPIGGSNAPNPNGMGGQPFGGGTSPTLSQPMPAAPVQTPTVQVPTVQTPTVQTPNVAAPSVPTPQQVNPLNAPGAPAPAQAQQPQAPAAQGASAPAAPAQPASPALEAPKKPEAPVKEKGSKNRRDKKSKKGKKEAAAEQEKNAPAVESAPTKAPVPVPQRTSPPTQAEEAATAYAKGDYATAESIWSKQAEAGDGQAMNNLGVLYDLGQGVEPDLGRALHWFAESAKTGHPSGMSNYGRMLEQGRGIEPNPAEAARWFDLAARQGQPEAQYNLGMLYELGRGVQQDFTAAAAWYSRAAAQQQTEALFRLGHFYRIGQGVTKNPSRAVLLLYAAAMNGDANAMKELEDMARAEPSRPEAVLFGQRLDNTDRNSMREALRQYGATVIREDDAYICDLYDAAKVAPGARQMAICYGPGNPGPLGFLELDYNAPNNTVEGMILKMVTDRFGKASAGEGDDAHLWNLGSVVVATRYEPTRGQLSLMYMVPRVYHLTRQR